MTRSRHAAVVKTRLALTPRTLPLTLGGQSLVRLASLPAQDVEVLVTDGTGTPLKRRYTIRHARPASGEIDLDVVRHDPGGPGSRWIAVVQVASDDDRMPVACGDVRWVTRDGAPADGTGLLRSVVDDFALPNSNGRAYLLGELQAVRILREALEARGLSHDRILAKSYWRARPALLQYVSA